MRSSECGVRNEKTGLSFRTPNSAFRTQIKREALAGGGEGRFVDRGKDGSSDLLGKVQVPYWIVTGGGLAIRNRAAWRLGWPGNRGRIPSRRFRNPFTRPSLVSQVNERRLKHEACQNAFRSPSKFQCGDQSPFQLSSYADCIIPDWFDSFDRASPRFVSPSVAL